MPGSTHLPGGWTFHTFDAFQNPSFRRLWSANAFTYVSRWMQITLLAWLVLTLTASPLRVALVGFFAMAPMLLIGAFGGVLADRLDRRRLMLATQTLNFAAAVAMTLLLFTGAAEFWHAYIIIMVTGISTALDAPSRRSMIHDLLGRYGVTNAMALDAVGGQSSKMLGPALAGLLITFVDVSGGYVVVTVFYLTSFVLLKTLTLPPDLVPTPTTTSETRGAGGRHIPAPREVRHEIALVGRNLAEGFRYVRSERAIFAALMVTVFMNFLLFPYNDMVPVIARDVLKVGPGLMGVLMAADGLGAMVGSAVIASLGGVKYHGRVYLTGSAAALACLLLFSFSSQYAISLVILLVLGLGAAGFSAMQATIIVLAARPEMRGRALGVTSLAIGSAPLGSLLVGSVANSLGPTFAIRLTSCLGIVALISIALLMPALRRRIGPEE